MMLIGRLLHGPPGHPRPPTADGRDDRQWPRYRDGSVTTGALVLALAGFCALTTGGWFGGKVVFVHGMRVEEGKRWTGLH
jgi:hypothetical protein